MSNIIETTREHDKVTVAANGNNIVMTQQVMSHDDAEVINNRLTNAMLMALGIDRTDEIEMEAITFVDHGLRVSHDILA